MAKDELEKIDMNPNFQKNVPTKQLVLRQSNLENLFNQFVIFIDATPNTIRTYRGSLKQWFLYLRQNQIVQPTAETVRQYRDHLQDAGKKATTVKNEIGEFLNKVSDANNPSTDEVISRIKHRINPALF